MPSASSFASWNPERQGKPQHLGAHGNLGEALERWPQAGLVATGNLGEAPERWPQAGLVAAGNLGEASERWPQADAWV